MIDILNRGQDYKYLTNMALWALYGGMWFLTNKNSFLTILDLENIWKSSEEAEHRENGDLGSNMR